MAELSTEPDGWDDKDDEAAAPSLNIVSSAGLGPLDSGIKRPASVELSNIKI
jgi:hypothetical protein